MSDRNKPVYASVKATIVLLVLGLPALAAQSGRGIVINHCEIVGKIDPSFATVITNELATYVAAQSGFSVIEREELGAVIKEQDFQLSELANGSLAKAGKLAGAAQILFPTVSRIGALYIVNLRLVDVETGFVNGSVSRNCRPCEIEDVVTTLTADAVRSLGSTVAKIDPVAQVDEAPFIVGYGPVGRAMQQLIGQLDLYPRKALRAGIEGNVKIEIVIDKTGAVRSYKVLSGDPIFAPAAEKLVRAISCSPAKKNGVPVDFKMVVPLAFRLGN